MYFPHLTLKENWQVIKALWKIQYRSSSKKEDLDLMVKLAIKGLIIAAIWSLINKLEYHTGEKIKPGDLYF